MTNYLTGKGGIPPAVVAAARGMLEVALLAALGAVVLYVTDLDLPEQWRWIVPALLLFVRTVEGVVDQIDPMKVRANELHGKAIVPAPAAAVDVDAVASRAADAAVAAVLEELRAPVRDLAAKAPAEAASMAATMSIGDPPHEGAMPGQGEQWKQWVAEDVPASAVPPAKERPEGGYDRPTAMYRGLVGPNTALGPEFPPAPSGLRDI